MRPVRPTLPLLAAALAAVFLAACRADSSGASASAASGAAPATAGAPADAGGLDAPAELRGRVAAHWFGRQWPKNFLSGFRREHVDDDFRQLAADGFDTVILLVAWGDFQPVADPCCTYDERAFERLRFLIDRADAAGLKVMLRVGYGWSFHPQAGDVGERQQQLLNRPEIRAAYAGFVQRVGAEIGGNPAVVMTFMSWEDQWLRRIDESARADYAQYLATRRDGSGQGADGSGDVDSTGVGAGNRVVAGDDPGGGPVAASHTGPLPDPAGDARAFHGYWDWLVREKLYAPARAHLPNLSYEARIDREPLWRTGADGGRTISEWLAHDGMYALPPGSVLTIYWAPFWGALNQGEQLPAGRSLELLATLLDEARERSGRPLFVDQFNVVDNTPGHESNAVLAPEQIPAFLHRAVCTLRTHDVVGYGYWTARDYAESPLHNPAFGYGLEGWTLQRTQGTPEAALQALPGGDFQLRLQPGDTLAQRVPPRHGRLPRTGDAFDDRSCVEADVRAPGTLHVRAGGEAAALHFDQTGLHTRCTALQPRPDADGLAVTLTLADGELALRSVQVFDHVQYGGLYDLHGAPGPLLEPMRRMNADFRAASLPARCEGDASAIDGDTGR